MCGTTDIRHPPSQCVVGLVSESNPQAPNKVKSANYVSRILTFDALPDHRARPVAGAHSTWHISLRLSHTPHFHPHACSFRLAMLS